MGGISSDSLCVRVADGAGRQREVQGRGELIKDGDSGRKLGGLAAWADVQRRGRSPSSHQRRFSPAAAEGRPGTQTGRCALVCGVFFVF